MNDDPLLNDRRRSLEDSLFAKRNAELMASLKQELTAEENRNALRTASGITDDKILDHILAANIRAETILALGIVPLLAVAWADGRLEKSERQAVLAACEADGIVPDSDCFQLLDSWLQEHPNDDLLDAWKDFIQVATRQLSREALSALEEEVLTRAENVARASGGILGIRTVSSAEQRVLDELRRSFRT